MTQPANDRSIQIGGNATGSLVTGDHNQVATTLTQVIPPPPEQVDIAAELAALRTLIDRLSLPNRDKALRALDDAKDEVANADKPETANALERAVKVAKTASDFATNVNDIETKVVRIAGWLGPAAKGLLALLGLTL